ncbi:hypothetical protein [Pyruvatibacter mobilis]|uniref:hypothetical protein n=1 Tax=Pyruvatibacter mobilis TaxID=1712261 RepID=UPI003BB0C257
MGEVEQTVAHLRDIETFLLAHPATPVLSRHAGNAADTITALLSQLEEMREALGEFVEVTLDIGVAYGEDENANAQLMAAFKRMTEAADKADALLSQTDEGERMEGDKK